uniref:3',5'-cyclic-nucleotide phosphodiesterase regA-like n=1 Tax=Dermatophagoides pteronyssinus TaxID=6956 RepID=A0A6P6Y9R7_DERPT
VDEKVMMNFLFLLQSKYRKNAYHSSVHGAMVAHHSLCILQCYNSAQVFCKEIVLALVIAALGHDVGHPAQNNLFHINTNSLLARMYQDKSVLENYHAFLTLRVALISAESNIFQKLPEEIYRFLRRCIIEFILATDIQNHFDILGSFRLKRSREEFDFRKNIVDQIQVAKMCIKAADLSHSFVKWEHHYEWSVRVSREFYDQGDIESVLGFE